MTKAQFLDRIKHAPDNALIVVPSPDHGYRVAKPDVTSALSDNGKNFTEDFGENLTPESEFGKRIPVIVIA